MIVLNNYLFIRLGDVLVVFAIFMLLRQFMTNRTVLKIGASTLSIYVIHFIILYGSFTGLGLYRFFHHELNPTLVIPGAVIFMIACTFLALQYGKYEVEIKSHIATTVHNSKNAALHLQKTVTPVAKEILSKVRIALLKLFGFSRS